MSRLNWAIFLAAIFGLAGATSPESSPSTVEGAESALARIGGVHQLLEKVHATTNSTLSVKLKDLPVGKTIRVGDSINGLQFVKLSDNQYMSILPSCNDGLSVGGKIDYTYATNNIYEFKTCAGHTYKLEVWGGQGGYAYSSSYYGGYGGYSVGNYNSTSAGNIFIVVGQQGINGTGCDLAAGGYNGGGNSSTNSPCGRTAGGGGGATHMSVNKGDLIYNTDQNNLLIVAGGGGGGAHHDTDTMLSGANAGGYIGNSGTTSRWASGPGGGTQTEGGIGAGNNNNRKGEYGKGGAGGPNAGAGGGGGLYGGGGGYGGPGGGGSGYIASSNLISSNGVTKQMKCYGCTTSTASETYTISVSCANANHDGNCANTGNGYARITRLN